MKNHHSEVPPLRPPEVSPAGAASDGGAASAPNGSPGGSKAGPVTTREVCNYLLWLLRRPSLKILVVTVFALVVLTHQFQELVSQAIWLPQEWRGPGIFLGYMFFLYAFQLFHKHEEHHESAGAGAPSVGGDAHRPMANKVPAGKKWVKTAQASSLFAAALICYAGHMYLRYVCLIPVEVPHERLSTEPAVAGHVGGAAAPHVTAAGPHVPAAEAAAGSRAAAADDHVPAGAGGHSMRPASGIATTADFDELIYVPWPMPEKLDEAIRLRGELPEVTTFEPNWLREETLKYRKELARTSMLFVMDFILISFFLGAAMTVTYSEAEGVHGLLGKYLH